MPSGRAPAAPLLAPLLVGLVLLVGCRQPEAEQFDERVVAKPEPPPAPAPKPTPEPPPKPAPEPELPPLELALGAAKIMPKDQPDKAVVLAPDGTITLPTEGDAQPEVWKLSADGKLGKLDGTIIAEARGDGSVTIGGKRSGLVLVETGLTLSSPDGRKVTMDFAEDGNVVMQPPPGPDMQMTAEGCAGPMARTCALVLAISLFTASSDQPKTAPPAQ